jgi:hypothetical protein
MIPLVSYQRSVVFFVQESPVVVIMDFITERNIYLIVCSIFLCWSATLLVIVQRRPLWPISDLERKVGCRISVVISFFLLLLSVDPSGNVMVYPRVLCTSLQLIVIASLIAMLELVMDGTLRFIFKNHSLKFPQKRVTIALPLFGLAITTVTAIVFLGTTNESKYSAIIGFYCVFLLLAGSFAFWKTGSILKLMERNTSKDEESRKHERVLKHRVFFASFAQFSLAILIGLSSIREIRSDHEWQSLSSKFTPSTAMFIFTISEFTLIITTTYSIFHARKRAQVAARRSTVSPSVTLKTSGRKETLSIAKV